MTATLPITSKSAWPGWTGSTDTSKMASANGGILLTMKFSELRGCKFSNFIAGDTFPGILNDSGVLLLSDSVSVRATHRFLNGGTDLEFQDPVLVDSAATVVQRCTVTDNVFVNI